MISRMSSRSSGISISTSLFPPRVLEEGLLVTVHRNETVEVGAERRLKGRFVPPVGKLNPNPVKGLRALRQLHTRRRGRLHEGAVGVPAPPRGDEARRYDGEFILERLEDVAAPSQAAPVEGLRALREHLVDRAGETRAEAALLVEPSVDAGEPPRPPELLEGLLASAKEDEGALEILDWAVVPYRHVDRRVASRARGRPHPARHPRSPGGGRGDVVNIFAGREVEPGESGLDELFGPERGEEEGLPSVPLLLVEEPRLRVDVDHRIDRLRLNDGEGGDRPPEALRVERFYQGVRRVGPGVGDLPVYRGELARVEPQHDAEDRIHPFRRFGDLGVPGTQIPVHVAENLFGCFRSFTVHVNLY